MIETGKFVRKPFEIDAVQVTEENMVEVAKWCGGVIVGAVGGEKHIAVKVHRPMNARQTKAYISDWVLQAQNNGFKVYTPNAFEQSFEPAQVAEAQATAKITVDSFPTQKQIETGAEEKY